MSKNNADTVSIVESSDNDEEDVNNVNIKDIVEEEPLYYVLGQFLETSNGKNITTVLDELVSELKEIKLILQKNKE